MIEMILIMSHTDSEIEIGRRSLRKKIIIDMDLMISYIVSEIETGRNSSRIMSNERRRGIHTGWGL